ncbi:MAG: DNA internalization-related competence protein ComEC/Rec2 [Gammaproteobacteria bacterium]
MRTGTIAFLLGCLAVQQLAALPALRWALPCLLLVAAAYHVPCLRLPAWFAAGLVWALWRAQAELGQSFNPALQGVDLTAEGYIAGIPEAQSRGTRVLVDITHLHTASKSVAWQGRVRLNWSIEASTLQVGERWRLYLRLKQAHGLMNPGGFDYEGWLYQQGIKATGTVRVAADNQRLAAPDWHYAIGHARQHIGQALARALPQSPYLGIVTALVIGAQDAITPQQWQVFTRTGTSHLVAISGLNITLVAGLIAVLVRRLWACWPYVALRFAAAKAAVCAALISASVYAVLAGFSIPTRRALIMLMVVLGARLWDRQLAPSRLLALGLLLVLLMDPTAPLTAGFWLSYGAVALLFYGMGGRLSPSVWWRQWGRAQWLVALGLLPMTLVLFQRASLIAPLANLFAEPWLSLLVTPLTLLGTLLLPISNAAGAFVLHVASVLLGGIWPLLVVCANLPAASVSWALPASWIAAVAGVGALLLLAPRGVPARGIGLVLLLPVVLLRPEVPRPGAVWFTLLDVGQGLAAVVHTAHHTLVFDTGPRFSDSFDTGAAVVLPYLRSLGINFVDTLVVSHGDNDHSGGAVSILANIPVAELLSSVPERFTHLSARCRAGQSWRWDGVNFRILHPDATRTWQGNNSCCVLSIEAPGGRVLMPADIEAEAEHHLVTEQADRLRAAILVAPHHGSRTSSTDEFISAVAPTYVLFPVGYRNRYGFPRSDVATRYVEHHAQRFDTDSAGSIEFHIDPDTGVSTPRSYRQAARRYWNVSGPELFTTVVE